MKKRFFLFILLLAVLFNNIGVYAFNVVKPTSNFYVNDYANILSNETEEYIMSHSVGLNNKNGTQIIVVTVKNLDGASVEDYSLKVARDFEIGSKEKNNGLLILVSLEDREMRIEVGYGLEEAITDGKAGRIRDTYMIPYLSEDDFDNGILNGYKAIYKEIVDFYKLDLEADTPQEVDDTFEIVMGIVIFVVIVLFILVIISFSGSGGYYSGSSFGGGGHHSGGSFGGHHGGGGSFGGGGASGRF